MSDIRSDAPYPWGELSNSTAHEFVMDGVRCASMEGFLQSLKFVDPMRQAEVCDMIGKAAKDAGQNQDWQSSQTLYWRGQAYDRHGPAYQDLLDRAFGELCFQSTSFRKALLASGRETLLHSIGERDPHRTVLTEQEFCDRLMRLRLQIQPRLDLSLQPV